MIVVEVTPFAVRFFRTYHFTSNVHYSLSVKLEQFTVSTKRTKQSAV